LSQKRCASKSEFKEKVSSCPEERIQGRRRRKNPNFYIVLIAEPQMEIAHRHKNLYRCFIGVLPSA